MSRHWIGFAFAVAFLTCVPEPLGYAQTPVPPPPSTNPAPPAANTAAPQANPTQPQSNPAAPGQTTPPAQQSPTPAGTQKPDDPAARAAQAADHAEAASKAASDAIGNANGAAGSANTAADRANGATNNAQAAASDARTATEKMNSVLQEIAAHPGRYEEFRAAKPPIGDYIPCLFDSGEQRAFRALPPTYRQQRAAQLVPAATVDALKRMVTPTGKPETDPEAKAATAFGDDLDAVLHATASLTLDQLASLAKQLEDPDHLSDDQKRRVDAYFTAVTQAVAQDQTYNRPDDVSCSFSIMQYKEAKDVFGTRVARGYVAIQVNIRNLNKKSEFLVHDIQLAVDTGLTPYQFGQFEASRDKLIVRGVAQRGQSEDTRNWVLNSLVAIGAILAPINTAVAQTMGGHHTESASNFGIAVSVFQGPIIAGYQGIWPDHTIDYLNHINDWGFSASSTNKTIIPVQGSVPLVTFLPQKPLEQLPFVECGSKKMADADARTRCHLHPRYSNLPGRDDVDLDPTLSGGPYPKEKEFKAWSPAALNILNHRVFVVVAGVHIAEVGNQPVVDDLKCPEFANNTIDISQQDANGNISCTASGSNLGGITSARLQQSKINIAATWTAASDGDSATLTFKSSDASGQNGAFELFGVDSSGNATDLKHSITFMIRAPKIESVAYSPSSLGAVTTSGLTVTIAGANLDRIGAVYLTDAATPATSVQGKITNTPPILSSTNPITITFPATAGQITGFNPPAAEKGKGTAGIQFVSLDDPNKAKVTVDSKVDPGFKF